MRWWPSTAAKFFTWVDSGNTRPQMPPRGHNQAHRYDLRQVGLALATTVHSQMPLFHQVYAGNSPDVSVFREIWPRLEERLQQLGLGAATAVYDTGNVSVANQRQVDESGVSYVTSVPPSQHPELLAGPLESFQPTEHPRLTGIRYSASQQLILRRQRLVVQTHSPTLAEGQLAGLRQHLAKAQVPLSAHQGGVSGPPLRGQS